ncbi:MAG: hypothetical protein AMXMBFR7_00620 [Planctomycetota bacterium]
MTPAVALWLLLILGFCLMAVFVYVLYRIGKALLAEEQTFLSEIVLATLFTGLCTAVASRTIYAFAGFKDPQYVVVLFMSFFMLSVLASTAYGLHRMSGQKVSGARARIVNLLLMWIVTCSPWFFILYAVFG